MLELPSSLVSWMSWVHCRYTQEGHAVEMKSISNEGSRMGGMGMRDVRKMLGDIKNERMGFGDKPDWIVVRATIWMFRHENFAYQACPNEVNGRPCNKKVTPSTTNGEGFFCEKCGRDVPDCEYRYMLSFQVGPRPTHIPMAGQPRRAGGVVRVLSVPLFGCHGKKDALLRGPSDGTVFMIPCPISPGSWRRRLASGVLSASLLPASKSGV